MNDRHRGLGPGPSKAGTSRVARPASRVLVLALAVVAAALPALAVDGVIEINQAKATAGGVTPADAPGFPVTIDGGGSYRLTADLTVPSGINAILILSNDVTIDLNGFTIAGGGGPVSDGIGLSSIANVEIRNGTIQGFSRAGIFAGAFAKYVRVVGVRALSNGFFGIELQGEGNTVDGCQALNNGSTGIRVHDGSLVMNSVARGNGSYGLLLGSSSGYRSNVLSSNNGGDANPQVAGLGLQLGSNVCGNDLTCP